MPRDVMPVFGRTPYTGPGKRGFTPPPTTPSTTPFTRRKGGRPTSRITAPPPTTEPVVPTPTISQQGKGIISSVDKGRTNRENRRRDRGTGTTKKSTKGTTNKADWGAGGEEGYNKYVSERQGDIEHEIESASKSPERKHQEFMEVFKDYGIRGRSQYGNLDPSTYVLLQGRSDLTTEQKEELMNYGLGGFTQALGAVQGVTDLPFIANLEKMGVQLPEEGIIPGKKYGMPGIFNETGPWGDRAPQDVLRHETVHQVQGKTNALLKNIKRMVQGGEQRNPQHPYGEVEQTLLDLFPDDLRRSVESDIDWGLKYSTQQGRNDYDLEELMTLTEDGKSGDPAVRLWAKGEINFQRNQTVMDMEMAEYNVHKIERTIDNIYKGKVVPPATEGEQRYGAGAIRIMGNRGNQSGVSSIGVGSMDALQQQLEIEKDKVSRARGRVNGIDRLEEYSSAYDKALSAYHRAGGDLESRSTDYEKIRFPGVYDESWQPGWPRNQ